MNKIWKFVIYVNVGVFFQFYCKVLLFDGLTDLPLTEPLQTRMNPWPGAQNPLTSYSIFIRKEAFWVVATFTNFPWQRHRTLRYSYQRISLFLMAALCGSWDICTFVMIEIIIKIIMQEKQQKYWKHTCAFGDVCSRRSPSGSSTVDCFSSHNPR